MLRSSKDLGNSAGSLHKFKGTTDTLSTNTSNDSKHDICLVSDSPHYIVQVRLVKIFQIINQTFI